MSEDGQTYFWSSFMRALLPSSCSTLPLTFGFADVSVGGGVAELVLALRFFAVLLSTTGVELVTDKAFAEDILF